ncbi:MAG: FtsX-like permease family protein [Cytophagales bacterium]|nr:FtsX-like permease family protein [Cytophagales bacterium]
MTKHLFRRINKQRSVFALGQFTLVLGMLSCLIIYGFVAQQYSYDSFYENAPQISRINTIQSNGRTIALTKGILRDRITSNFFETSVTHFMKTPVDLSFAYEERIIPTNNGLLVDPAFPEVFQLPGLDDYNLLDEPNGIILTQTLANQLFDEQSGINEIITVQMGPRKLNLTVKAVIEDLPNNSSLSFDYLLTGPGTPFWNDEAPWTIFQTFLASSSGTQNAILAFINEQEETDQSSYGIQPLSDIHLSAGIEFDTFEKFDAKYLTLLTSTGVLIFLVTLFNFFNLFYNQITARIREITTKKVLGSSFSAITKSLLFEIYFQLLFAAALTYGMLYAINEPLSAFLGFEPVRLHYPEWLLPILLGAGLFATVMVLIASAQMNAYDVQNGLRGKLKIGKLGFNLGKLLLAGQFMVTFFAVTSGLFIVQQTSRLQHAEVGYDYENLVTIKRPEQVSLNTWNSFQDALDQQASVLSTGLAVFPGIGEYNMSRLEDIQQQEQHRLYWIGVDPGFIPSMNIELVVGRNFDQELQSDAQSIIINQKALTMLGGESALQREYKFRKKNFKIIGVVRDFHHKSLKEAVEPMMMTLNNPQAFRHLIVRYSGINQGDLSEMVRTTSAAINIPVELGLRFMESEYNQKLMKEESILAKVVASFSAIAILVSLLGLFSFLTFEINQRKSSLSIMKVLGAQFRDHLKNLSRGPILTMLFTATLTIPIALYYLSQWKSQFLFQIELGAEHILAPLGLLMTMVLLIATLFSVQIERTNPVIHLKDE